MPLHSFQIKITYILYNIILALQRSHFFVALVKIKSNTCLYVYLFGNIFYDDLQSM